MQMNTERKLEAISRFIKDYNLEVIVDDVENAYNESNYGSAFISIKLNPDYIVGIEVRVVNGEYQADDDEVIIEISGVEGLTGGYDDKNIYQTEILSAAAYEMSMIYLLKFVE